MNWKKSIFILLVVITVGIVITNIARTIYAARNSVIIVAIEKSIKLKKVTKNGLEYIESKYNKKFEVEESDYTRRWTTVWVEDTKDIYINFKDGTRVLYIDEEEKFYDDYQAKNIIEDIEQEIWNPMLEKLSYAYNPNKENVGPTFNFYESINFNGSFFNKYYDGNIKKFIEEDDVAMGFGYDNASGSSKIFIISDDGESWKEQFELITKTISNNFEENIPLVALTRELYIKEVKINDNEDINIAMEGCWGERYGNEIRVSRNIKIADGVYAVYNENEFILEEGDIRLKEVMKPQELQAIFDDVQKDENITYKYTINSLTPIYELEFSDRVKEKYDTLKLYFRVDHSELNISSSNKLYSCPSVDAQYGHFVNGVVQIGKLEKVSVNKDKEFFWIGTLTKETIK